MQTWTDLDLDRTRPVWRLNWRHLGAFAVSGLLWVGIVWFSLALFVG